jgi:hypothetical protein
MRKSATGHAELKNPRARRMRLRALYRDMVLRGEVSIGSAGAVRSMTPVQRIYKRREEITPAPSGAGSAFIF